MLDLTVSETINRWKEAWGATRPIPRWGFWCELGRYEQETRNSGFDPYADVLISEKIGPYDDRPDEINVAFARVGTIAKITLKGLPPGDRVCEGSFSHGNSWISTGEVFYDPYTNEAAYMPFYDYDDDGNSLGRHNRIDFEGYYFDEDRVYVDANGEAVIWLRTFSGTLDDYFAITVTTEDGSNNRSNFHKEVNLEEQGKSITFFEGDITAFSVGMERVVKVFEFSEHTLTAFPEIVFEEPEIKIPDNSDDDFPIFFESDLSWSVSLSFPEGEDTWLDLNNNSINEYYLLERTPYYEYDEDDVLHTALLTFVCTDPDYSQSFSIPIREYRLLTLLKDGVDVSRKTIHLDKDDSFELTVVVDPALRVRNPEWRLGEGDEGVSLSDGPDGSYSKIVSATDLVGYDGVIFRVEYYKALIDDYSGTEIWCAIQVGPDITLTNEEGEDVTYQEFTIEYGNSVTLEAVFSYLPEGVSVSNILWNCNDDWQQDSETGEWIFVPNSGSVLSLTPQGNPPYYSAIVEGKEGSIGQSAWVNCDVELEDESGEKYFLYSYCEITVTGSSSSAPSMAKKATSRLRQSRKPSPLIFKQ